MVEIWRRLWAEVISFSAFSPEVGKLIYTPNAIESLNNQVRKAFRNKATSPATKQPPN